MTACSRSMRTNCSDRFSDNVEVPRQKYATIDVIRTLNAAFRRSVCFIYSKSKSFVVHGATPREELIEFFSWCCSMH